MRFLSAVLACLIWFGPASAEKPVHEDPPARSSTRLSWQQRFAQANTSRDGRLTLAQATAGYPSIARNFSAIDAAGRGYVTVEDITAWRKAKRDARQAAKAAADDPLRPRNAMQIMMPLQSLPDARLTEATPAPDSHRSAADQAPSLHEPATRP